MEIYLPIAQVSINWLVLLGLGVSVGFLSGMLGGSGGFITPPLLIPSTAFRRASLFRLRLVRSQRHLWLARFRRVRRTALTTRWGLSLLVGGTIGSAVGGYLFKYLQQIGQINLVIQISYVLLLGSVRRFDAEGKRAGHSGGPQGNRDCRAQAPVGTPGFTIYPLSCVFAARVCISAQFLYSCSAFWSGS